MNESNRSNGPPKTGCTEKAMNMEVDSVILLCWVSNCLWQNKKMMEQIYKEVITFDDHLVTAWKMQIMIVEVND